MIEKNSLSLAGAEIVGALTEFYEALGEGSTSVAKKFTIRTVELKLEPQTYAGPDMKRVRELLGLSQPLFARFLGVSANAIRAWENGGKKPSGVVCRFLDEIAFRPEYWRTRLGELMITRPKERLTERQ